jgi:hypothetical protein
MAPAAADAIAAAVAASPLNTSYGEPLDRESAYEKLAASLAPAEPVRAPAERPPADRPTPRARTQREEREEEGVVEQVVKSSAFKGFLRSAGTALGREITRSVLGTARRRR